MHTHRAPDSRSEFDSFVLDRSTPIYTGRVLQLFRFFNGDRQTEWASTM